jgi:hypothetical protein
VSDEDRLRKNEKRSSRRFGILFWLLVTAWCIGGTMELLPKIMKRRSTGCRETAVANLKQIDGAKEQWALEAKTLTNEIPAWSK